MFNKKNKNEIQCQRLISGVDNCIYSIKQLDEQIEKTKKELTDMDLWKIFDESKALAKRIDYAKREIKDYEKEKKSIYKFLASKSYLFDVSIVDLLDKIEDQLQKQYPDIDVSECIAIKKTGSKRVEDTEDKGHDLYENKFVFGYVLPEKEFLLPEISVISSNKNLSPVCAYLDKDTSVNILSLGILTDKNGVFGSKEWQKVFMEIVIDNLAERAKEIEDNNKKHDCMGDNGR